MNGGRHQGAGNAKAGKLCEVVGAADPASREHRTSFRTFAYLSEPFEIRPGAAADARQRHGDHAARPSLRPAEQIARAHEIIAAEVERQQHARMIAELIE